jgi:hypothetical protein
MSGEREVLLNSKKAQLGLGTTHPFWKQFGMNEVDVLHCLHPGRSSEGTSAMISGSDGEHPADSASGPSGCPRYRETPD